MPTLDRARSRACADPSQVRDHRVYVAFLNGEPVDVGITNRTIAERLSEKRDAGLVFDDFVQIGGMKTKCGALQTEREIAALLRERHREEAADHTLLALSGLALGGLLALLDAARPAPLAAIGGGGGQ